MQQQRFIAISKTGMQRRLVLVHVNNVVEPHRIVADHAKPIAGVIEELTVDAIGCLRQYAVTSRRCDKQFIARDRPATSV